MTRADTKRDENVERINDLWRRSTAYASTPEYLDTMRFVARFKSQGPYNAYLLQRQNPQVSYAATASVWQKKYGATVKPDARPLVILVPFGPVDFVYDISDVIGDLPKSICDPFPATGILNDAVWLNTLSNAEQNNIGIEFYRGPPHSAGSVSRFKQPIVVDSVVNTSLQGDLFGQSDQAPEQVTAYYLLSLNAAHERRVQYMTLLHELAHVFCGHLGRVTHPQQRRDPWQCRDRLDKAVAELEAESAAYLAGRRMGINSKSEHYLVKYVEPVFQTDLLKQFSFEAVLTSANRLESWGRRPSRKR
jgi:hypothetical protein